MVFAALDPPMKPGRAETLMTRLMARSEIVRRALVRKEIPLYATMGLIGGKAATSSGPGAPTAE